MLRVPHRSAGPWSVSNTRAIQPQALSGRVPCQFGRRWRPHSADVADFESVAVTVEAMTSAWWTSRSIITPATTSSPKTSSRPLGVSSEHRGRAGGESVGCAPPHLIQRRQSGFCEVAGQPSRFSVIGRYPPTRSVCGGGTQRDHSSLTM